MFDQNFADFIECLNKNEVRFVLVGGYAAVIHGNTRTTGDMDFFVDRTEENAKLLVKAIADFGFGGLGFKAEDVMNDKMFISMGIPPLKIDILTSIPAVSFKEVYEHAIDYEEENVKVKVIDIHHLIRNKTASGRPKDMDDVRVLSKKVKKM